jgi:hypothetical protein
MWISMWIMWITCVIFATLRHDMICSVVVMWQFVHPQVVALKCKL